MTTLTEIRLVSLPGSEPQPAPLRRRVQRLPSADGRAAVTLVSWLARVDEAGAVAPARDAPALPTGA